MIDLRSLVVSMGACFAIATSVFADDTPATPASSSLDSIVVSAKHLAVQSLIDRKVYTVTSSVQSDFGALSDLLSELPSVDIDPDGVVSLRGNTNVLILVDGKPSAQFSGPSAADNLRSFPAKDIERIEILTTPPPQYKAEGTAGVINIITRKSRPERASGFVQGSVGQSGNTVDGAGASYQSQPLKIDATLGYRHDLRERVLQSNLKSQDSMASSVNQTDSLTNEAIYRSIPSAGLMADYTFDDRQSLNGSLNWVERHGNRKYTQVDESSADPGPVAGDSESFSSRHDVITELDAKLGFIQKLARPQESLTFSLTRSTSRQRERYDILEETSIPTAAVLSNNVSLNEDLDTTEAGADYSLPLSKTQTVKAGYAFEQDGYQFGDIGNNVDPATGVQMLDPSVTDNFRYQQRINAAYGTYQGATGTWTYLSGARAEFTYTDLQQLNEGIRRAGSYFKIFPSLNIKWGFSDHSTLSLGASSRITRPEGYYLNPYVQREYSPNWSTGNPNLRPQFTHAYELGYELQQQGLTFDLTGYHHRNRDSLTDVTEYPGNGIALSTKANLPKDDSEGVELILDGHIVPAVGYTLSSNLFHEQIDATALGAATLESTTGINTKLKLDFRPTTKDTAQINVIRSDKSLTPQGFVSAMNVVNCGYRHQLKSDLTAVATLSDVFNGQRFQRFANTPTFTQEYERTYRGRILYVGLVYAVGSTKDKQPTFEYVK